MPQRIYRKVNGRALGGALVMAVFFLVGVIGYAYNNSQERIDRNAEAIEKAELAVTALCLTRGDLEARIRTDSRRLARSRQYLRDHPRGTKAIPEALIRAAIADDADALANSMKFRENLEILSCGKEQT